MEFYFCDLQYSCNKVVFNLYLLVKMQHSFGFCVSRHKVPKLISAKDKGSSFLPYFGVVLNRYLKDR